MAYLKNYLKYITSPVVTKIEVKKNNQGLFFPRGEDSTFLRNFAIYRTTLRRIPEDITCHTFSSIPAQRVRVTQPFPVGLLGFVGENLFSHILHLFLKFTQQAIQ